MKPIKYFEFQDRKVTFKENVTAYGNRFFIQLEDTNYDDNSDFRFLVDGKKYKISVFVKVEPEEAI